MKPIETRKDFEMVIRFLNGILSQKYNDFVGITFFGSRNRNDFSSESDFDILVLFSRKPGWQRENEISDIIYETGLKYDLVIDAKVYHDKEVKKQNTPFRVNVLREGTFYGI